MRANVTVDATAFRIAIGQLAREVGGLGLDTKKLYRSEALLFIQRGMLASFRTPPKTLKQGRLAVERDIRRAAPSIPKMKGKESAIAMREAIAAQDTAKAQAILHALGGGFAGVKVVKFDPKMHTSQRNRRGRVTRKNRNVVVIDPKAVDTYVSKMQKTVGTARAGYVPALRALGGRIPAWINKPYANELGGYDEQFDLARGHLDIITKSTKIPGYEQRAKEALALRARAIETKTRALINRKAVNLGFTKVGAFSKI